jgi:hypothetical protein
MKGGDFVKIEIGSLKVVDEEFEEKWDAYFS